jgi:hypothetical protein
MPWREEIEDRPPPLDDIKDRDEQEVKEGAVAEVMQTVSSGREVTVEKRMIPRKVWLMPVRAAI